MKCLLYFLISSRIEASILLSTAITMRSREGPGDLGSIPGRVIPKTKKMILDASLFNTQHYKVQLKGKVKQSRKRNSALPYILVWYLSKREPSGHPRLKLPTCFFIAMQWEPNVFKSPLVCVYGYIYIYIYIYI